MTALLKRLSLLFQSVERRLPGFELFGLLGDLVPRFLQITAMGLDGAVCRLRFSIERHQSLELLLALLFLLNERRQRALQIAQAGEASALLLEFWNLDGLKISERLLIAIELLAGRFVHLQLLTRVPVPLLGLL